MFDKDFMFWPPNLPVLHYCAINNRPKCLKYLVLIISNRLYLKFYSILKGGRFKVQYKSTL